MRFLIFLFVTPFLIFSLFSASYAESLYEKHVADGISAIEAGNYEAAIDELGAALGEKPGDHTAALHLGIAHSRAGNEKEAEMYLKQALRTDPLSPKVNLELGLLYKEMGLYAESRDFLMTVQDLAPDTDEASVARDNLVPEEWAIQGKKAKDWAISLAAGTQYDSNVILTSDDGVLPEGVSNESDWRFFAYLDSNYFHPVTDKLSIGPFFSFYQSLHTELDDYDTRQFRPGLAIRYRAGDLASLSLKYAYENTSVGEDLYLVAHDVTPQVIVPEGSGFISVLKYRYRTKDFRDTDLFATNDERDGENHEFQFSQYIPVSEPVYLRLGYAFDRNSADTDYWSYKGSKGYAGLRADLGKMWVFDMSGEYYLKEYDEKYTDTDKKREDRTKTFSVSLSKTILKTSSAVFDASLGYVYVDNSSNLEVFDYTRDIVTLSVRVAL